MIKFKQIFYFFMLVALISGSFSQFPQLVIPSVWSFKIISYVLFPLYVIILLDFGNKKLKFHFPPTLFNYFSWLFIIFRYFYSDINSILTIITIISKGFLRNTLLSGKTELIHRYKASFHQVKSPSQLPERSKPNFRKPMTLIQLSISGHNYFLIFFLVIPW